MTLLEQQDVFRSGKHRNIALFRSFSSIQSRDFYAHHVLNNCRQDEAGARSSLHRRTGPEHKFLSVGKMLQLLQLLTIKRQLCIAVAGKCARATIVRTQNTQRQPLDSHRNPPTTEK